MKAYYATQDKNVDITLLDWKNTTMLSFDAKECQSFLNQWRIDGLVVELELDDKDVLDGVLNGLYGNSFSVKVKVLRVI